MKGTNQMTTTPKSAPAGTDAKIEAEVVDETSGKRFDLSVTKRDAIVAGIISGVWAVGVVVKVFMTKDVKIETEEKTVNVPTGVSVD